mmetsp:Transcript_5424/g.11805  ORF Transcript_5424/g.11805 Transcript_5424/m.11805 type:complete len:1180 (+) Transcript_5424:472-4011(+)
MQTTQILPSPSGATREDYSNGHAQHPGSRSSPARRLSSQNIRYRYPSASAAGDRPASKSHSNNFAPVAAHVTGSDCLSLSPMTQDDNGKDLLSFLQDLRFEPELARSYCLLLKDNGYDDIIALDEASKDDLRELGIKIGHVNRMRSAASCSRPTPRYDTAQNNPFFSPNPSAHGMSSADGLSVSIQSIAKAQLMEHQESLRNIELELASASESQPLQQAQAPNYGDDRKGRRRGVQSSSSSSRVGARSNTAENEQSRLTANERLEAHKARKNQENKHMKERGKWPTPEKKKKKKTNLIDKVPRNDAMVEQLASNAQDRRRISKMKQQVDQVEHGYRNATDESEQPELHAAAPAASIHRGGGNDHPVDLHHDTATRANSSCSRTRPHSQESTSYANATDETKQATRYERSEDYTAAAPTRPGGRNGHAVTFHHDTAPPSARANSSSSRSRPHSRESTSNSKPSALMHRSGTTPDTRRKIHSRETSSAEKRTPRGHTMTKPQGRMSSEFGPSFEDGDGNESERSISVGYATQNRIDTDSQARCATGNCSSTDNLEEDLDNPGLFYCKRCWDEWDTSYPDIPQAYAESREDPQSVSEDRRMTIQREPEPHQEPQPPPPNNDRALWIVHDNPQLGKQIIVKGPKRMKCMLETKEPGKKNCVRIAIGIIDYSGPVSRSDIDGAAIPDIEAGAECLRLRSVRGYIVDHSTVESRLSSNKSIYEFHLDTDNAKVLTGGEANMTAKEFLRGCEGSVDVIIDPQCSSQEWYPQREASEGSVRKLAPQFRSKGVGYIRLGDDMSRNGQAFLSSNACKTFFSKPTVSASIVTTTQSRTSRKHKEEEMDASLASTKVVSKPAPKSRQNTSSRVARGKETRGNKSRLQRRQQLEHQIVEFSDDDDEDDMYESDDDVDVAKDILKQLQSAEKIKEMKWDEAADLITRLSQVLAGEDSPKDQCISALGIIQDLLGGKNVTVHILRAAVKSVGDIGERMGHDLAAEVSWRPIMLGMLTLLRNKQCNKDARQILNRLHGKCWTLANSLPCLSHSLGLGKDAAAAGSGRRAKSSASARMTSPDTRKNALKTANNVEVLEWLAGRVEAERTMADITPMAEKSCLLTISKFFLSHVGHRDPRCRRSVVDGLLHTIIYGIDRLGLKIDESHEMCEDYKSTNPRGWESIKANVCKIRRLER